ncbi:MAG: hypothetical protein KC964_31085 [Candidatus Omnitrophica bacterium]|nr:hypothetical protein [Candidatus Omnitrophota bacterium]
MTWNPFHKLAWLKLRVGMKRVIALLLSYFGLALLFILLSWAISKESIFAYSFSVTIVTFTVAFLFCFRVVSGGKVGKDGIEFTTQEQIESANAKPQSEPEPLPPKNPHRDSTDLTELSRLIRGPIRDGYLFYGQNSIARKDWTQAFTDYYNAHQIGPSSYSYFGILCSLANIPDDSAAHLEKTRVWFLQALEYVNSLDLEVESKNSGIGRRLKEAEHWLFNDDFKVKLQNHLNGILRER